MKPLSKDLENIIEEAKYQIRLEIAEKCLTQRASVEFIMKVCDFTKEEVITIFNDLKKINLSINRLLTEQKQEKQVIKHEMIIEMNLPVVDIQLKLQELKLQERELKAKENDFRLQEKTLRVQARQIKRIEKQRIVNHKLERQKSAEIQRKIAAANTRLLMERIKEEQKNNKLMDKEQIDIKEQKVDRSRRKTQTQILKNFKEESLEQELNFLSKEQKMIASVGKCYLRGLNVEQAILFSRQSKEDVERIYKSFKNK